MIARSTGPDSPNSSSSSLGSSCSFGGASPLCGSLALRLGLTKRSAKIGLKKSANASDVSRATAIVSASERKKTPVTPVKSVSGRKTTTGVIVEPMIGAVISEIADLTASRRDWPRDMCV